MNHFQLQRIENLAEYPGPGFEDTTWFRPGDWHDSLSTLQLPGVMDKATMRFLAERFVGPVVMHCHILPHEDRGMMATACVYENDEAEFVCRRACLEEATITQCSSVCFQEAGSSLEYFEECYEHCKDTCEAARIL